MYNEEIYERLKRGENPEDILVEMQAAIQEAKDKYDKDRVAIRKKTRMKEIVTKLVDYYAEFHDADFEPLSDEELNFMTDLMIQGYENIKPPVPVVKKKVEAVRRPAGKQSDDDILRQFIRTLF